MDQMRPGKNCHPAFDCRTTDSSYVAQITIIQQSPGTSGKQLHERRETIQVLHSFPSHIFLKIQTDVILVICVLLTFFPSCITSRLYGRNQFRDILDFIEDDWFRIPQEKSIRVMSGECLRAMLLEVDIGERRTHMSDHGGFSRLSRTIHGHCRVPLESFQHFLLTGTGDISFHNKIVQNNKVRIYISAAVSCKNKRGNTKTQNQAEPFQTRPDGIFDLVAFLLTLGFLDGLNHSPGYGIDGGMQECHAGHTRKGVSPHPYLPY